MPRLVVYKLMTTRTIKTDSKLRMYQQCDNQCPCYFIAAVQ